jgi:hypothetical protein
MTFREMNLKVFAGKPVPRVLFQPRVEPWYHWHTTLDELPDPYKGLSLQEFYDELNVSVRYFSYYTDLPDPRVLSYAPEVEYRERYIGDTKIGTYQTAYGELSEEFRLTANREWMNTERMVKGPDDLKKLRWLHGHLTDSFSAENFERGRRFMGDRGEPQFWAARSPYQALALQFMEFESFIYALFDCPAEMEETMRVIDASYDQLWEEIIACGQVRIVNFGENLHDQLLSPRYFDKYLLPFYEKRATQLKKAGIYTHIHIDGHFRSLLKYLKHLPFDGLEALTPLPQGDVSLEEMKEHIGDKVLLDGIPAVMFTPTYSTEQLMHMVEQLVESFHPRLILGVSDEVPAAESREAIEKVRLVSEWCEQCNLIW